MYDVIAIGSALVDIFIQADRFRLQRQDDQLWLAQTQDEKIEVDSFQVFTGGGASNTAVGFSRLGFRTGIVSELGADTWAQLVVSDLEKEDVDTSLLIREKKEETGGSVILSAGGGGRTIMVHRGAASMLDPHDLPRHALSTTTWTHLSSIAGQLETLRALFAILVEHKRQFSWNPGQAEIELLVSGQLELDGLRCSVLLVNQGEWQALAPVQSALNECAAQIVVTEGQAGGKVYQGGKEQLTFQAPSVAAINATGAGDSFAVGYVAGVIWGKELAECANYGVANAASVVQQLGAKNGLLYRDSLFKNNFPQNGPIASAN